MHNRMKKFKISYMKIFKKVWVIEELQKKLHQLKKQYIVRNSQAKLSQKKQGNDLR
jgi:ribosomal protein L29